ncbi:MAG TPA: cytochrome c3 family protein [Nitrospirota bacterium]|nr:cytochrome c3 family protein [Nitrospirota bacterium]
MFLIVVLFAAHPVLAEENCLGCHNPISQFKVKHPAVDMGCSSCHNAPHAKKKAVLSLAAEVPGLCFNCHDKSMMEKKSVHPPVAGGMCISCHNPHGSANAKLLVSQVPDLCFQCHDKSMIEKKTLHAPVAAGMCTSCHNPHATDNARMLVAAIPALCFQCHATDAMAKKNVHVAAAEGKCLTCHNPHSAENNFILTSLVEEHCQSCHDEQRTGKHVMIHASPGDSHPLSGKPDPLRPGFKLSCASCHNPHASVHPISTKDMRDPAKICLQCHTKIIVPQ